MKGMVKILEYMVIIILIWESCICGCM